MLHKMNRNTFIILAPQYHKIVIKVKIMFIVQRASSNLKIQS